MANETTNPIKKYLPRLIFLTVLLVGGYFGYQKYKYSQTVEVTDNAQIEGKTAPVLARTAGFVQTLNIEDYQNVKANDLLIEIDAAEYRLAVSQAEADIQQALADLETAKASIKNTQEAMKVAQANANVQIARKAKLTIDLQRDKNLFDGGSIIKKVYDESKSNLDIQDKQIDASQALVSQAKVSEGTVLTNIKKMEAVIKVKQTSLEQAKLRLTYTKINAPISGKVGRASNLAVGQYVQPGQTLFTIVNGEKLWVTANFKETQLNKIRIGQMAEIKVDAYPDLKLTGKVVEISESTGAKSALLPPDNASGNFVKVTQKIPVKIELTAADTTKLKEQLRVGMSVEVTVKISQ
jgi:membrane fusion protein, multidrug efflux system